MSVTGDRLRAAAARVRAGWCRHALALPDGSVCAVGALGIVSVRSQTEQCREHAEELVFIVRAIGRDVWLRDDDKADIVHAVIVQGWNDAPGQTVEGVALGLELAAILADEEAAGKRHAASAAQEGWPA